MRGGAGLGELGMTNAPSSAIGVSLTSVDVNLPRTSGVQLHVTSLPDGRLGDDALRLVDWLHDAGQTWWQMLPLGPPDRARSPYKASSAFASWPGLLGSPGAAVSLDEEDAFRAEQAYWLPGWEAF